MQAPCWKERETPPPSLKNRSKLRQAAADTNISGDIFSLSSCCEGQSDLQKSCASSNLTHRRSPHNQHHFQLLKEIPKLHWDVTVSFLNEFVFIKPKFGPMEPFNSQTFTVSSSCSTVCARQHQETTTTKLLNMKNDLYLKSKEH